MKFSLLTFGDLALLDDEGRVVPFPEKGLLIIAYLLASERASIDRTRVAQFLWGYDDIASSLTNLRKLVSRIRSRLSELDAKFLIFDETEIHLDRTSLTSDILSFGSDAPKDPFEKLALLVTHLRLKFLDKANCRSQIFTDWLANENKRHLVVLQETLDAIEHLPTTPDDVALIKEAALFLFLAQPEDTNTHRMLLKTYDAEGEVDQLRRVFEQRKDLLSSWSAISRTTKSAPAAEPTRQSNLDVASDLDAALRPTIRVPRLVLLPPSNHSRNAGAAMLASSLIEDITLGFCAMNSLRVIAPYSAVQISRQTENHLETFERYDISYVLDTRLSGLDSDISLFSQLIYLSNSEIVWAERFSLDRLDLARDKRAMSRHIALAVAGQIERHELTRAYFEQNPAAYHRYLLGRQYLNRLTLPNLRRARKELKSALQESADFAPALSSIARTYSEEWLMTARGDIDLLKSAEAFATRAMEARADLADGYREFGVAKLLQGAFDESAEAMELAETLGPHYADVIADHADTLVHCSRPGLALQKIERAIELNPLSPDSYLWIAAGANYALEQFDASLDYIDQMADASLADRLSAANWAMLGHKDKARVFVRRVREANPDFDVDKWLSVLPTKEQWHRDLYCEGLKKAGF